MTGRHGRYGRLLGLLLFGLAALRRSTGRTPGASIAYTLDDGKPKRWSLYVDPVTVEEGKSLRAKACRLGFKDSQAIFADPAKSAQP